MTRILVVDDDADARHLLERILTSAGYTVLTANDGHEGRRKTFKYRPAAVVTDLAMPERHGLQLIAEIKRNLTHTPVLAVTGEGRPVDAALDLAKRHGAEGLLGKPLERDAVLRVLDCLLRGESPADDHAVADEPDDDGVAVIMPPDLLRLKCGA